ncbi:helix-turn-helix domain-containing protein [Streptomyces sp. 6N223]|uniref:helix-turn-helix domain-containing protein n=1 Tax=Streptomyces sp. 6N223 TaxID=3457412 RepID=UPI003FD059CA
MTVYSDWEDVKRRMRELHAEISDEEWQAREEAARIATDAYVLGYHLKELREKLGLTGSQVAAKLGMSLARVSQIEHGEIHNLDTMRTYAAALGARITLRLEYDEEAIAAA